MGGLFYLQGAGLVQMSERRLGWIPEDTPMGVKAASVNPGQPAERAGVAPGDLLLAVDGHPVARLDDYLALARGFEHGQPVVLRIEREGRRLDLRVVPGMTIDWLPLLISAVTALCYLGILFLALTQGADDLRSRLLAGFSLAVALELALPVDSALPLRTAALGAFYLLTGLQMGLELHLASLLPERHAWLRHRPWVVPLYYGVGIGLGTLACVTYVAEQAVGSPVFPWTAAGTESLLLDVGLPLWALTVAVLVGIQALRHPEPRGRHQAWLVLSGVVPWLLFILAGTLLGRLGRPQPEWLSMLEPAIQLWYPIAFFTAIFRFHLFDIELVVRRSLIYTALTGSLVLVFYAAVGAGGALLSYLVEGQESVWAVSLATLLLGLLFSPLRRRLQEVIGRRFFPERYALRQRLVALAGELPAFGKLPLMGHHLVGRLTAIFGARSATLLIADPETGLLGALAAAGRTGPDGRSGLIPLDDTGIDLLRRARRPLSWAQLIARSPAFAHRFPEMETAGLAVPLLSHERLIGVLLVGRKEGSRRYPAEEVDLLNLLAHHVATVFENARLFESATYEGLTGLLRREAILAQLDRELERALRYDRPLSIAMADLDHFKDVNDRHGHLGGDALLRRIAQVLAEGLRSTDWVGRYGGEEFLILLPETELEEAGTVAEKIRALVQRTAVGMEDGSSVRVTVSVGLASLRDLLEQERGRSGVLAMGADRKGAVRELIAAADRSLYEAKHRGRNRVVALAAVPC